MQFKFVIEANNAAELKAGVIDYCKTFGVELEDKQIPLPLHTPKKEAPVHAAPVESVAAKPVGAKRGPKPREVVNSGMVEGAVSHGTAANEAAPAAASPNFLDLAPPASPAPKPVLVTDAPAAELTDKHVLAAVKLVNEKKSLAAARDLINKFGADRASQIPKAKWGEFIAAAEALVK